MCVGFPFLQKRFPFLPQYGIFLGAHAQELPDKLHTDGERDEVERPRASPVRDHGRRMEYLHPMKQQTPNQMLPTSGPTSGTTQTTVGAAL